MSKKKKKKEKRFLCQTTKEKKETFGAFFHEMAADKMKFSFKQKCFHYPRA